MVGIVSLKCRSHALNDLILIQHRQRHFSKNRGQIKLLGNKSYIRYSKM